MRNKSASEEFRHSKWDDCPTSEMVGLDYALVLWDIIHLVNTG